MTNTIIRANNKNEYLNLVKFYRIQGFKFENVFVDGVKQTNLRKENDFVIIYL